eukprot:jgi/Picsp_1/5677/NSC_03036-R1_zinc finger transcription factor-like protein
MEHCAAGEKKLKSAEGHVTESPEYYKSDDFRIWSMKVVPCSKRYVHDWTECPFSHQKEKATRRDPKLYQYTGIACPSMKKEGTCAFGDQCPYAHNVFEYWLHPTRYRTQMCNDGEKCNRKICFFAHNEKELRNPECKPFVAPEMLASAAAAMASANGGQGQIPQQHLAALNAPRMSVESVRQSQEWGPAAMPCNVAGRISMSEGRDAVVNDTTLFPWLYGAVHQNQQQQQQQQQYVPMAHTISSSRDVNVQDDTIIGKLSSMVSENKISFEQAMLILQRLGPQVSVTGVAQSLKTGDTISRGADASSFSLDYLSPEPIQRIAQEDVQKAFVLHNQDARLSLESESSNYDPWRMSVDTRANSSFADLESSNPKFSEGPSFPYSYVPRSSYERTGFLPAKVTTPTRHSTGNIKVSEVPWEDHLRRLSLGDQSPGSCESDEGQDYAPTFNPYNSTLFQAGELER